MAQTRKRAKLVREPSKQLKRLTLAASLVLLVGLGYLVVNYSHASTSYVHVSGGAIYDGSGNHIFLSGVDGGGWMARGGNPARSCPSWSAAPAQAASLKQMGYNTERIAVSWANLETTAPTVVGGNVTHHWNTQYLAALDGLVQADANAGIMAIIDMHQAGWSPFFTTDAKLCEGGGMPVWLYTSVTNSGGGENTAKCEFFSNVAESGVPEKPQDGMAAAWQMLAARYAGNPTLIGADLFNEPLPGAGCGPGLASMYEKLGSAVRQGNSQLILMYEDNAYDSYMNQGFKLDRKPNFTNALYSWHLYAPDWATGQPPMAAHLARAQQWGVPLWIGETDAMVATRTTDLTAGQKSNLVSQMSYFQQNDISWTLWGYDNGCCAVVYPSGSATAKPALLATLAAYMYRPGSSPTPTPPTPPPTSSPPPGPSSSPSPTVSPGGGGSDGGGSGSDGEGGGTGVVSVAAPGQPATVTVDGQPVQASGGKLDTTYLPNGTHTVTVTQDGKTTTETIEVHNKLNPFQALRDFLFAHLTGNHLIMNAATVTVIVLPFVAAGIIFKAQLLALATKLAPLFAKPTIAKW